MHVEVWDVWGATGGCVFGTALDVQWGCGACMQAWASYTITRMANFDTRVMAVYSKKVELRSKSLCRNNF